MNRLIVGLAISFALCTLPALANKYGPVESKDCAGEVNEESRQKIEDISMKGSEREESESTDMKRVLGYALQ